MTHPEKKVCERFYSSGKELICLLIAHKNGTYLAKSQVPIKLLELLGIKVQSFSAHQISKLFLLIQQALLRKSHWICKSSLWLCGIKWPQCYKFPICHSLWCCVDVVTLVWGISGASRGYTEVPQVEYAIVVHLHPRPGPVSSCQPWRRRLTVLLNRSWHGLSARRCPTWWSMVELHL